MELIKEFNEGNVYYDFSLSNSLFFVCVNIFTFVQDLNITVKVLTSREILISPKGKLMDFIP